MRNQLWNSTMETRVCARVCGNQQAILRVKEFSLRVGTRTTWTERSKTEDVNNSTRCLR
jgi:hypothetical protein